MSGYVLFLYHFISSVKGAGSTKLYLSVCLSVQLFDLYLCPYVTDFDESWYSTWRGSAACVISVAYPSETKIDDNK